MAKEMEDEEGKVHFSESQIIPLQITSRLNVATYGQLFPVRDDSVFIFEPIYSSVLLRVFSLCL